MRPGAVPGNRQRHQPVNGILAKRVTSNASVKQGRSAPVLGRSNLRKVSSAGEYGLSDACDLSAPGDAAPYTHLASRSSAGFQPVYPESFRGWSPISNRQGWRRFWARGKARKASRLEALRYSRLETCATACGRSKMRERCRGSSPHEISGWDGSGDGAVPAP